MGEIRAGGHVIGEHGWIPADLAEQDEPAYSMSNNKAELLAAAEAAGVEADESMTKRQILEALEAD